MMVGYGMAALLFRAFWPDAVRRAVIGVAGDRALSLARHGHERADHALAATLRLPPASRAGEATGRRGSRIPGPNSPGC